MRIQAVQLLKSSDLGRHSLLYLKDIGHGWFGKVLLGEVNMGLSTTQVVVKELKASASVQEQMQFLEEVQPYRTLQHPALLQCLAQCSEVTPYLLVMEFCPLGDLKSYLSGCRVTDSETPDPLILQRMACDVASGLLHLHKNNFIHNDLALRNCLLTSDMTVKIGDYGLSQSRYKEDYYVTPDQIWVPLRWIAPELIDEVHGNLLLVDQTKPSNIWSLGVTVWELFELGNQPYRLYSDRQVLTYAVKEQQLKLPKPQIQFPLVERWYEVMQFCWLQPELRPSSEEVHLLVTYLCAKGSSEAEEDFEQRWNTLKPNLLGSTSHTSLILTPTTDGTRQTPAGERASSAASSFPLLDHFSDSYQSDTGDDLLTVTETSHGLNFEYKWEESRAEQPYCSSSTSGPLGQGNPHYQDIYYSSQGSPSEGCKDGSRSSSASPSYYEPERPSVVPVLSAHSPSVSSEYYIRIEETADCSINMDDDYSPTREAYFIKSSSESVTSVPQPIAYWSTANNMHSTSYESDTSPTVQLTSEPQLRRSPNTSLTKLILNDSSHHTGYCEPLSSIPRTQAESSPAIATACSENQCQSHATSSPSLGFRDPYLEANDTCLDPLEKTLPFVNHVSVDLGAEHSLLVSGEANHEPFDEVTNWASNHSANNNILSFDSRNSNSYLDLHYNSRDMWSLTKATTKTFHNITPLVPERAESGCIGTPMEFGSYIYLRPKDRETAAGENTHNLTGKEGSLLFSGERLYSEPKIIPELSHVNSPSLKEPKEIHGELSSSGLGDQWLTDCRKTLLDSSFRARGIGLSDLGICSEDEEDDIADITSGLFADFNLDFAEDEELSPLKNHRGTPVSTDTLTLSMESPSDQAFSPDPFPVLPKSLDSGYDTENNASPEFIFREFEDFQESYGSQTLEEESGTLQHVRLAQGFSKRAAELKLMGQTEKNPYRDSAYFSESENEKTPREEGTRFFANDSDIHADQYKAGDALLPREVKGEPVKMCQIWEGDQSSYHLDSGPVLSMLAPFPAEMGGCLTKEAAPAENNLDLETEHLGEDHGTESEPGSEVQEPSANYEDGNTEGDGTYSYSDSTLDDYREENGERSTEEEEIPEFNHVQEGSDERGKSLINGEDFEDIDAEECDSQESLCEESNGQVDLSSSSSLLELCGENVRAPLEEAEEAEDEDDSDDSESDEELRIYNIQEEESEESEEDVSVVPVVVSDCSSASHLRSLLKMPSVITQSFCDELERKKKAVSFFDDVTVFLFDQESPTGELADYTFSNCGEPSKPPEGSTSDHQLPPDHQPEVRSSVKVLDQSEEGGGCEFEDPSVEPCPPSPATISEPTPPPPAPDSPKPADVALNRFVVSRFSITHVSDADTGKATGNSEDEPTE